jgi:putative ABC transport system permease protein
MTLARLARIVRHRVSALFRRDRLDRELDRELALHLDCLADELVADGWSPADARREARRRLGNLDSVREACRDSWRVTWWSDLKADVRYGLRVLAAAPAFTTVALVSLALGIGANAAVLGVIAAVRFDSLPMADADRLIVIRSVAQNDPGVGRGVSAFEYAAFKARARTLDGMALAIGGPRDLGDDGAAPAERVTGQAVTAGFFELLAVQPEIGRLFTAEEADASARVVILSHELWQRRYGGDPGIIGRAIRVDSGMSVVIGVTPESYSYRNPRVDFWTPMSVPATPRPATSRLFLAVGRVKPALDLADVRRELSAIAALLAGESPATNAGWDARISTLRDELFGWTQEPLLNLQAAVGLVLLLACTNLSALLLARGSVRRREIAMRIVLGAGRARVIRQLLTESLLLSGGGAALGLLVAWAGLRGLSAVQPPPFGGAPLSDVHLDWRTIATTATLAVATALLFGMLPALASSKRSGESIEDRASVTATRRAGAFRRSLVAIQIAIAFVVLVGFGLLINSFVRLTYRNLNFQPSGLLMFEARTHAPQKSLGQHNGVSYFEMLTTPSQAIQRIHERLKLLPGVQAVAGMSFPPVDSLILPVMDVRIDRDGSNPEVQRAAYFLITPGVFDTLGTPLLSGRDITESDTAGGPWVAIINAAAARRFWPGQDPIGRHLRLDAGPDERPRDVIAVAADIPTRHGQIDPQPVIYASYLQQPTRYRGPFGVMFGQMTFLMRHPGDPVSVASGIRRAVAEVETRPVGPIMTADRRRDLGSARIGQQLWLLALLAAIASVLAAIGVYGTLAYTVSQRNREIGVRKALGAGRADILAFVGRHAATVVFTGLAAGWLAARALMRLLASQLWGITSTDLMTYVLGSILLAAAASLACVGPARRAMSVDPTVALRTD